MDATASRIDATTTVTFNSERFSELVAGRGAEGISGQAIEVGVHRATLDRWRKNKQFPSLPVALGIARQLGVPVESLWQLNDA